MLLVLLEASFVDVAVRDANARTAFILACEGEEESRTELVRALLRHPAAPGLLDRKDANGESALLRAVWHCNVALTTVLLDGGADWSVCDLERTSPLARAIGRRDVVEADALTGAFWPCSKAC